MGKIGLVLFGLKGRIEEWAPAQKSLERQDRRIIPSKSEWSIPGGLVNVGETLLKAVVQEAFEETVSSWNLESW